MAVIAITVAELEEYPSHSAIQTTMMHKMSDRLSGSARNRWLSLALSLYMATVGIAVAYYNWQYARENGFARWAIFGEIVPTAKAIAWPYFALRATAPVAVPSPSKTEVDRTRLTKKQISESEVKKFILAINYSQQATYLLNSSPHENLEDYPNLKDILAYRRKALDVAKAVDPDILNDVFPDLGTRFKNQFVEAVSLFVQGCEKKSDDELSQSKLLNDQWADWYGANRKAIEDAANKAIGAQ
jgi:hypothetical protein